MVARGLLVGVPRTSEPSFEDLPGTSDDVAAMAALLTRQGFDPANLDIRPDGCTVPELTITLEHLRDQTRAGDLTVFYFTGHGHRARDTSENPDEEYDQFLVLSDGLLRDDWFRPYWESIADGSRWVTFADCCFAGTVMRNLAPFPPDLTPIRTVTPRAGTWRLHLAATPDDQYALALPDETPRPGPRGGTVPASYATATVLRALEDAPNASYRAMMLAVQSAANDFLHGNVRVGRPVKLDVSVSDRLLDSPAFQPLDW